jgi:urease accessory protein
MHAIAAHARGGPAHQAPVFGAVFGALGIWPHDAEVGFLHGSARGVLSAAVRLGVIGPFEAQRVLAELSPHFDRILAACARIDPADSAQAAPLVELFGALHDDLDSRLFQS